MDKYLYNYGSGYDSTYCYPDSDVLINKMDIRDAAALADVERKVTGLKILHLQANPVNGSFDLLHLRRIHKAIFEDLYEWAGEIRQGDFLIKGNTLFCRGIHIEQYAESVFQSLKVEKYLRRMDREKFIERLAYYMGEVNALHPFREGNGRTQRLFFYFLCTDAGYELDFSTVSQESLIKADIAAFDRDYSLLIDILNTAISAPEGS